MKPGIGTILKGVRASAGRTVTANTSKLTVTGVSENTYGTSPNV